MNPLAEATTDQLITELKTRGNTGLVFVTGIPGEKGSVWVRSSWGEALTVIGLLHVATDAVYDDIMDAYHKPTRDTATGMDDFNDDDLGMTGQ